MLVLSLLLFWFVLLDRPNHCDKFDCHCNKGTEDGVEEEEVGFPGVNSQHNRTRSVAG